MAVLVFGSITMENRMGMRKSIKMDKANGLMEALKTLIVDTAQEYQETKYMENVRNIAPTASRTVKSIMIFPISGA